MIYAKLLLVPRDIQIKILNVSKIKATLFLYKKPVRVVAHIASIMDEIRLEQKRSPLRCSIEHLLHLRADFECSAL